MHGLVVRFCIIIVSLHCCCLLTVSYKNHMLSRHLPRLIARHRFEHHASLTLFRQSSLSSTHYSTKQSQTRCYSSSTSTTISSTSKLEPSLSQVYINQKALRLFGGYCVLLQSPRPEQYSFIASNQDASCEDKEDKEVGEVSLPPLRRSYQVDIDDVDNAELLYGIRKELRNMKQTLNQRRLNRFIGGRVALRRSLKLMYEMECDVDIEDIGNDSKQSDAGTIDDRCSVVTAIGPILADPYGAPDLPSHIHGSISHKDDLGLALAIIDDEGRVGCDIELCTNTAAGLLQNRILTQVERDSLGKVPFTTHTGTHRGQSHPGLTLQEDIMLRFSFKESVFKAIHPFLARSVDFTEVQVFPTLTVGTDPGREGEELSGSAKIDFILNGGTDGGDNDDGNDGSDGSSESQALQFSYDAYWCKYRGYFITTVYVRSNGSGDPSYKTKHHRLTQGQEV